MRLMIGLLGTSTLALATACQGEEGPRGAQGLTADDGQPGVDGLRGPKGERGPQGLQGEQGEPGRDADEEQIVFRLASLRSFVESVGNVLAAQHQDLFVGPEGPQGDQGIPGPMGRAGRQGERGAQGERGEQGVRGPVGYSEIDILSCRRLSETQHFQGRFAGTHQIFCEVEQLPLHGGCAVEDGFITANHEVTHAEAIEESLLGAGWSCRAKPENADSEMGITVYVRCCNYRSAEQ
jgi:hypothetical protein